MVLIIVERWYNVWRRRGEAVDFNEHGAEDVEQYTNNITSDNTSISHALDVTSSSAVSLFQCFWDTDADDKIAVQNLNFICEH